MTIDEILVSAPVVLDQLTRELVKRGDEEYRKNPESQESVCFLLAIRSSLLLCGMGKLLTPQTRDRIKVLAPGFLEARDLLMTYRFDDQGIRNKVSLWAKGDLGPTWKAEHARCEEYFGKLGYKGSDFTKKWSQTTLAHPTRFAAQNSTACVTLWAANPPRMEDFHALMKMEIADYLTCIATLIVIATYDVPGLISLRCDINRMPNIDAFKESVFAVAVPVLNKRDSDLPNGSYRS